MNEHDCSIRLEKAEGDNIRIATEKDAKALIEIYAPYVEKTAITFEYEVPTIQEFEERMGHVLKKYPYLVAERDGQLVGYAYAGPFKERAAYDWAVETTVYVRKDQKKTGIGRKLYKELERALSMQNILNLNACIAYPRKKDPYLTKDSVFFHQHMGYRLVGECYQCGYKFGHWYNMVWLEKHLDSHLEKPLPVLTFPEIRDQLY